MDCAASRQRPFATPGWLVLCVEPFSFAAFMLRATFSCHHLHLGSICPPLPTACCPARMCYHFGNVRSVALSSWNIAGMALYPLFYYKRRQLPVR